MAPLPRTHSHRCFTRSKSTICDASSSLSSPSHQVCGMEHSVKNQGLCACKERQEGEGTNPFLTKDIFFSILLFLPAKVLIEVMRYVCREWYNIIIDPVFISAHHQVSSTGIITQNRGRIEHVALYLESSTVGLTQTELQFPFPAGVLGSCHGLVLLQDISNIEILHVVNPITEIKVSLPPLERVRILFGLFVTLSCTTSGFYKVVHFDYDEVMVYTIGVDKVWRIIDLVDVNFGTAVAFLHDSPLSVGKFVYWYQTFYCVGLALDVDTETIHLFSGPNFEDTTLSTCVSMERGLGLIRNNGKENKWEVWEMTDLKASKWAKVFVIDKESLTRKLPCTFDVSPFIMTPISLKNDEELWIREYGAQNALACYNITRGDILVYLVDGVDYMTASYDHVNTLISPKKC